MKYIIIGSGILGSLLFAGASIIGGLDIEGYNFLSQYISESYASGTPDGHYFQKAFMVGGTLLALFGFLAPTVLPKSWGIKIGFVLFAIFYGLGTLVTGIFPCDMGCELDPENPSLAQFIHTTSATITYTIVPFSIIGLGLSFNKSKATKRLVKLSLGCGIVSLVFVAFLFGDSSGPYRGLFQRIIESGILFWVVGISIFIFKYRILKK